MYRKIGLALGFGLVSLPASAEGEVAGHLELGIGGINNHDASVGIIGLSEGAARFNAAFGNGWNLQADYSVDTIFVNNFSAVTSTPAVHLWHGDENYAAGVLAGASYGGVSGGRHYFAGSRARHISPTPPLVDRPSTSVRSTTVLTTLRCEAGSIATSIPICQSLGRRVRFCRWSAEGPTESGPSV